MVIRKVHDPITIGHPGYQKIVSFITQNYYWPGLKKMVQYYIQNCHSCKCAKAPRDRYNGLLKPLPIPSHLWTDVTLDFVTSLPISNAYNIILIVVDCLIKEKYYIPYSMNENSTTTETTTKLLFQNVWKLHDLLSLLSSYRGPQFISGVWNNLCKILGISANLSTSFHLETDGQNEIANQKIKKHLHTFVNYQQDDLVDKLPMAEFAANNNISSSTKLSPFFTLRGLHPCMNFDVIDLFDTTTRERINKKKAIDISKIMQSIWKYT